VQVAAMCEEQQAQKNHLRDRGDCGENKKLSG